MYVTVSRSVAGCAGSVIFRLMNCYVGFARDTEPVDLQQKMC